MPARDIYDKLNLAAAWFAAIGTNAAVIVALGLSYRQSKGRMRVRVSVMNLVEAGNPESASPRYLNISATNSGFRDIVVTGIEWRIGWIRPAYFVQIPPVDVLNPRLPAKLAAGDGVNFLIPIAVFESTAHRITNSWSRGVLRRTRKWRIRAGVYTSYGTSFMVRPDDSVMAILEGAAQPQVKAD